MTISEIKPSPYLEIKRDVGQTDILIGIVHCNGATVEIKPFADKFLALSKDEWIEIRDWIDYRLGVYE